MWKEDFKREYWVIRFYGISKEEFDRLSNITTLPVLYRHDITTICYEWFQYAKTDLGEFYKYLCNTHGYGKWESKRREAKFPDGVGMVIGRVDNLKDCRFLQK